MSTMADVITHQVSEQVKRAMEVAGSAKPVHEGEPSYRPEGMPSFRPMKRSREVARSEKSDRLPTGRQGGRAVMEPVSRSARGTTAVSATASTPYATHSRRTRDCAANPSRHGQLHGYHNLGLLEEARAPRAQPRPYGESYTRLWRTGSQSYENDLPLSALWRQEQVQKPRD
ncbi:hypothetical protein Cgig2_030650 [Carnegiea gigantea]|uniref:Uncharacterized protein n=1 Tax=Carnegiea gigantea TaxID=171969 RepID=A0A9Q1K2V9_9CARY|nr:hypothetical protein Cgig2_030650 [Carnegiea gigantea]